MIRTVATIRRVSIFLSLTLPLLYCGLGLAQTKPKINHIGIGDPKTVLYVGNSFFYFNDSMHQYVLGLTKAADPKNQGQYRSTSITISGSGLNWHDVESYFKPGGVASYSFAADNEPTPRSKARGIRRVA